MKEEKKVTKNFNVPSADKLYEILGAYDENLNVLTRELGAEIYVDGLTLRITGGEKEAALCQKALAAALAAAEKGETIDERQTVYCAELAKSGEDEAAKTLFDGAIATTAAGKKIKCKTLGQKRYADAIDKFPVVFGVGPAGTGKTFLAVAKAVTAFKAKKV
ncbi:MAG: PhoH family protein, partial [Candidatus Scatosoma sp.]